MEKIFIFKKNQIFYELIYNLTAQGIMDEEWFNLLFTNEGEQVRFTLWELIPYKNLLFKTGGKYGEEQ